jgi:hypothetical protein
MAIFYGVVWWHQLTFGWLACQFGVNQEEQIKPLGYMGATDGD